MAMSHAQIVDRAQLRAELERLHTFKVNEHLYLVKSRQLAPGSHHMVSVNGSISCDCPGYTYRRSCTHVEAVRRRLARETKPASSKATPVPPVGAPSPATEADRAARKAEIARISAEIWGE